MKTREELVNAVDEARAIWASANANWDAWNALKAARAALIAYDKENI